jgi:hypothetical protein
VSNQGKARDQEAEVGGPESNPGEGVFLARLQAEFMREIQRIDDEQA